MQIQGYVFVNHNSHFSVLQFKKVLLVAWRTIIFNNFAYAVSIC